jgi:hypothetical protein
MSDETQKWTKGELFMSALTAFVIGSGSAFGVGMLFSKGAINVEGLIGVALAGGLAAAKDYRSLKRLPQVKNGNGDTTIETKP